MSAGADEGVVVRLPQTHEMRAHAEIVELKCRLVVLENRNAALLAEINRLTRALSLLREALIKSREVIKVTINERSAMGRRRRNLSRFLRNVSKMRITSWWVQIAALGSIVVLLGLLVGQMLARVVD